MPGVAFGYIFGGEGEVVETGFGCDFYAVFSCFAEDGDGFNRRQVDDVEL